jgi:drug/metabolite transporter (DMT)-like permease
MAAAALVALPFALVGGPPPAPGAASGGEALAVAALVVAGTLLPFAFFAFGQARVRPEVAGTFANLEPLVGAGVAVLAFGDAFGPLQALGAGAILAGIALSSARTRGRGAPAGA